MKFARPYSKSLFYDIRTVEEILEIMKKSDDVHYSGVYFWSE